MVDRDVQNVLEGEIMGVKTIYSREELALLGHGTVVVLGPDSTLEDGLPSPLALQKVVDKWYAIGSRGPVDTSTVGTAASWPALVVFEP